MQNFIKLSSENVAFLRRTINSFYFNRQHHVNNVIINSKEIYKDSHKVSNNVFQRINDEYRTLYSLFLQNKNIFSVNKFLSKNLSRRNFSSTSSRFFNSNKSSDSSGPNKNDKDKYKLAFLIKGTIWGMLVYIFSMTIAALLTQYRRDKSIPTYISWNDFVYEMLAKGEVQELIVKPELDLVMIYLHEGAIIKGQKSARRSFYMFVNDIVQFEEKLRTVENSLGIRYDQRVPITYDRQSPVNLIYAFIIMSFIAFIFFNSLMKSVKFMPTNQFMSANKAKYTLIDPATGGTKGVRFSDVAGLSEAKVEITEFVDYLKNPEKYQSLGAKVPQGALLLGPPGCGKTLLAKALATEANVPFLSMNGSEFIELIGGLGAARMRDLFSEAKKHAPSIIYIDEIDAIGQQRSSSSFESSSSEKDQTLNQLLVEMDGMQSKKDVIVLASTNRSEVLDKALLRPGRFDRHILIDLPTLEERKQIFELHLKGIVLEYPPSKYSRQLANLTPGFSGADIAAVCNEAALHAAREKKKIVDGTDLYYAIDRMIGGPEKRDNAMSPTEKKIVAYHEAGHALVGWLLEHTDALLKVTIVPRTNLSLGFAQYTPLDQKLYSSEQLFDRMCMTLGGRAAENIIFNSITHGAQNDLEKVTKIAYAQVQQFGMNELIGLVSFDQQSTDMSTKKPYSKKLTALMDLEARKLIAKAYYETEQLLSKNKDKLELLANELLKRETLNHKEVTQLIGPPPFGNKKFIDPEELQEDFVATPAPSPNAEPNSSDSTSAESPTSRD